MSPSPQDPSDVDPLDIGPAVSPRVTPRGSELGALGEPVAPFVPHAAEPETPPAATPDDLPSQPSAGEDTGDDLAWLYPLDEVMSGTDAAAPASVDELDIDLAAGWEQAGEPLELSERLPESGLGSDDALWGSFADLDSLASLLNEPESATERWSEFAPLGEESPTVPESDTAETPVHETDTLESGQLDAAWYDVASPEAADHAGPEAELAGMEEILAAMAAAEVVERPVAVDAVETPIAVEGPEPAAGEPVEPTLPAVPLPGLGEVADRLERIARSLRSGSPAELLGAPGSVDPLQLLITGYALGYSEAVKTRGGEGRSGEA